MDMKISGIYRLQFPSGHYYIGSSIDYVNRCRSHQNTLKRKCHDSPRVQNVYDKYGHSPIYGLIHGCPKDKLEQEEQRFLDEHVGKPRCLNISKCAEAARRGVKGKPHSEERKIRMSVLMKDRIFTKEHRARISQAKKGKYFPGSHTKEANEKRKTL